MPTMQRRSFLLAALAAPAARSLWRARTAAFLDDISRRSFQYFWEQSDPKTGITRPRALRRHALSAGTPRCRKHGRYRVHQSYGVVYWRRARPLGEESGRRRNTRARDFAVLLEPGERRARLVLITDRPIQTGARTGATFDSAEQAIPKGRNMKRPKSEVSTSDSTCSFVAGRSQLGSISRKIQCIVKLATDIYEARGLRMDAQRAILRRCRMDGCRKTALSRRATRNSASCRLCIC